MPWLQLAPCSLLWGPVRIVQWIWCLLRLWFGHATTNWLDKKWKCVLGTWGDGLSMLAAGVMELSSLSHPTGLRKNLWTGDNSHVFHHCSLTLPASCLNYSPIAMSWHLMIWWCWALQSVRAMTVEPGLHLLGEGMQASSRWWQHHSHSYYSWDLEVRSEIKINLEGCWSCVQLYTTGSLEDSRKQLIVGNRICKWGRKGLGKEVNKDLRCRSNYWPCKLTRNLQLPSWGPPWVASDRNK